VAEEEEAGAVAGLSPAEAVAARAPDTDGVPPGDREAAVRCSSSPTPEPTLPQFDASLPTDNAESALRRSVSGISAASPNDLWP